MGTVRVIFKIILFKWLHGRKLFGGYWYKVWPVTISTGFTEGNVGAVNTIIKYSYIKYLHGFEQTVYTINSLKRWS